MHSRCSFQRCQQLLLRGSADLGGRKIRELDLPAGCLVAAVRRAGRTLVPSGETEIRLGDRLLVIGEPGSIQELFERYGSGSPS